MSATRKRSTAWVALAAAGLCSLGLGFASFLTLDAQFPFPEQRLRRPSSTVVRDVEGRPLRVFLAPDDRYRLPVGLDDVSPELVRALVGSEDRWFYRHPGVNPLAVLRATWSNLRARRVVSGASTIPMQIARMVESRPRTFGAKLVEAFRALQLDWHHDKDELLELYLNLTPYGGNLEGVEAAAWRYFEKPASRLSLGEAALLAALPRSPIRYD
ncbi:MAG: transglycosylase domain-containing protein, partial [Thermoanaerobaculia bacterium]